MKNDIVSFLLLMVFSASVPAEKEAEPVGLDTLLRARERLRSELPRRLTDKHRALLNGLARAEPDWTLLQCSHAAELPALRWKLTNLQTFRQRRPADFEKQASILEAQLQ